MCPFDCTCIIHYTSSSICKLSQIRHFFYTDDGQAGYVLHEQDQNATKDLNKSASMIFRPMDLMKQMISVACGKEHALLLSSSGEVYSLGNGRYMVGSEIDWLFNTGSIWRINTHLKFWSPVGLKWLQENVPLSIMAWEEKEWMLWTFYALVKTGLLYSPWW